MPELFYAPLASRTALSMTGEDTHGFLNNLITINMDTLDKDGAGYGGLLTPQGKILFDFFMIPQPGGYLFDCATSQKDALIKRLTFYKLRAAVEISDLTTTHSVAAFWGGGAPLQAFTDPRTPEAGARLIASHSEVDAIANATGATQSGEDAYNARRIALGLGDSDADIGSGILFPHEANFDQFGGVDFAKGCYVGQEVVSRTEHRGNARKRLVPVSVNGPVLEPGAGVSGNGKSIGALSSLGDKSALALLRLDRVQETYDSGGMLSAGDATLELIKPGWAHFDMPERTPA